MAKVTFEIGVTATVAAGGTIAVPAIEGALGSVERVVISGGTLQSVVSETGTTGLVTAAAAGAVSLNGSRAFLFCGDAVPSLSTLLVEATALGDKPTRSAAFAGLPGVQ